MSRQCALCTSSPSYSFASVLTLFPQVLEKQGPRLSLECNHRLPCDLYILEIIRQHFTDISTTNPSVKKHLGIKENISFCWKCTIRYRSQTSTDVLGVSTTGDAGNANVPSFVAIIKISSKCQCTVNSKLQSLSHRPDYSKA